MCRGGTGDVPSGDFCHDPNWSMPSDPPTSGGGDGNGNMSRPVGGSATPAPIGENENVNRPAGGSATPSPTEEEPSPTNRPTRLQRPPRPGRSSPPSGPVMTPSPTAGKDSREPIPMGEPVPSNLLPTETMSMEPMPASPSPPEEPTINT